MRLTTIGRPGANVVTLLHMEGTLPDLAARVYYPRAVNLVRTPWQLVACWWNDAAECRVGVNAKKNATARRLVRRAVAVVLRTPSIHSKNALDDVF
jgi:hypothetical protein